MHDNLKKAKKTKKHEDLDVETIKNYFIITRLALKFKCKRYNKVF